MSCFVPNFEPVGNDFCLSPVEVDAAVVIVDNGIDCFWYHRAMDPDTADRLAFAIMHGSNAEAFRVDVKLILPAANDLRAELDALDRLVSDPIRARLRAG